MFQKEESILHTSSFIVHLSLFRWHRLRCLGEREKWRKLEEEKVMLKMVDILWLTWKSVKVYLQESFPLMSLWGESWTNLPALPVCMKVKIKLSLWTLHDCCVHVHVGTMYNYPAVCSTCKCMVLVSMLSLHWSLNLLYSLHGHSPSSFGGSNWL